MPSTHVSLHFHVVFSTKERREFIADPWRERLHAYLGGTVRALGGIAEAVGGTRDHVHMLLSLRATHCLSDVMREVKGPSSEWMHTELKEREFAWQEGYGAFTVSPNRVQAVKHYIATQEEHHRKRTFQEEYLEFLKEGGVEYDERYLW